MPVPQRNGRYDIKPADPLYLADTNILLRYARRDEVGEKIEAQYHLLATPTVPLISFVIEAELRSFAGRRAWGEATVNQMNYVLTMFRRVPIDSAGILDAYVAIDIWSHSVGITMGKNDLWIARQRRQ